MLNTPTRLKRNFISFFMLFLVTCSSDNSPTEPTYTPPVASFNFTPTSGYAPLPVQFTSTSTGDITTYAWDFQNNLSTESSAANPAYIYTVAGVYSIKLTVSGPGGSNFIVQENSLTVLEAQAPIVEDINATTDEDVALSITLTATDPQDLSLVFNLGDTTSLNGTASLENNIITYTPNANWSGTETLTYKANNSFLDSNEGTITIIVNAVDDEPNTFDVSATTDEDTPISIVLNADEVDGESYTFSIIDGPANGTTTFSSVNTIIYTPNTDWNGTDTFTFEATDSRVAGRSNVATATITVNAINDAPVANNVTVGTDEERSNGDSFFNERENSSFGFGETSNSKTSSVNITLDATDVDSSGLTYSVESQPSNGTLNSDGTSNIVYTPTADWNGTDTFTYKANDGSLDSNTATVTINVNSVNDAPTTTDETVTVTESINDTYAITITGASDPEGDALTYTVLDISVNGSFAHDGASDTGTFTATTNLTGDGGSFTYKVTDTGGLESNVSTVTLNITNVNDAPVTSNQSISTNEDTSIDIALSATDGDGDSITYSIVSDVSNGSTSLSGSTVTYTPTANYNGTDNFTFKANDGTEDGNTSTVTITVVAVNDAPVANNVSATTDENRSIQVSIALNATDVDGDNLTYSIVSDVSNGSTSLSGSTVTYTPTANYNGTDTFTYIANDGTVDSNTATGTITVSSVNDEPVTTDQTVSTDEDTAVDITLTSSDVESDTITYSIVSDVSNGSTSLSGSTVTYTPSANYNGTDTFTFKANDGTDDSNTSTVTITIAAVNDAPVANNVTASTSENRSMQLSITLDATDVDGDNLTYSTVASNNGTISISEATATYTPDINWNGTDTFTYKANDGT
ncbi:Ig-like domain-containing protein, partial [Candidatus Marinimicrobia bacterium]|nr:Ig-like domain-containing protein [Candidatus Neomarinimicrobiota bacterium]